MSDQPTGVGLNAKLSIWFFLTSLFPLTIDVDGVESKGQWGSQFLSLAPGSHRLSVSWKLYWVLPVNNGTLDLVINPGQVVPIRYKVRWIFLLPGKLYVDTDGAPPAPMP
jgi:hypothetical protein